MNVVDIDCYYSLSSPWAYLGGPRLQDMVRRHRARLTLKPYDFQAVVPRTGGVPLRTRPQPRRRYHQAELDRWRTYLGMPLVLEPKHYPQEMPADPDWNKYAGWMVIAAQDLGLDAFPLSHAMLRALWAEERDISVAEVRRAIADGERLRRDEPGGSGTQRPRAGALPSVLGRGGEARRVRSADVCDRRRVVLGPGPARLCRSQARRDRGARPSPRLRGERVRVRGRTLLRRVRPPLTPALSP